FFLKFCFLGSVLRNFGNFETRAAMFLTLIVSFKKLICHYIKHKREEKEKEEKEKEEKEKEEKEKEEKEKEEKEIGLVPLHSRVTIG
ncbi:hypothetical protein BgiBS90_024847, partial [Biomphalaria glabrata]